LRSVEHLDDALQIVFAADADREIPVAVVIEIARGERAAEEVAGLIVAFQAVRALPKLARAPRLEPVRSAGIHRDEAASVVVSRRTDGEIGVAVPVEIAPDAFEAEEVVVGAVARSAVEAALERVVVLDEQLA